MLVLSIDTYPSSLSMHGRVIQFSRCIHASIKTIITQRLYRPLAPSLDYFVAH